MKLDEPSAVLNACFQMLRLWGGWRLSHGAPRSPHGGALNEEKKHPPFLPSSNMPIRPAASTAQKKMRLSTLWRPLKAAAHRELFKILGSDTQWEVVTCFVPSLDAAFPLTTQVWTWLLLCLIPPLVCPLLKVQQYTTINITCFTVHRNF